MYTVLLVIHTIVVLFLIGIVLIQRSDNDGMGLSGSSSGQFLSGRASANLLTRSTAILATVFMLTSLILAMMAGSANQTSVLDQLSQPKVAPASEAVEQKLEKESAPAAQPAAPAAPSVPKAE